MDLADFPMDKQKCPLLIGSCESIVDLIKLILTNFEVGLTYKFI
jgi:hypothetical protein